MRRDQAGAPASLMIRRAAPPLALRTYRSVVPRSLAAREHDAPRVGRERGAAVVGRDGGEQRDAASAVGVDHADLRARVEHDHPAVGRVRRRRVVRARAVTAAGHAVGELAVEQDARVLRAGRPRGQSPVLHERRGRVAAARALREGDPAVAAGERGLGRRGRDQCGHQQRHHRSERARWAPSCRGCRHRDHKQPAGRAVAALLAHPTISTCSPIGSQRTRERMSSGARANSSSMAARPSLKCRQPS